MDADLAKYQAYRNMIENLVFRGGNWPHSEDTVFFYRFITYAGLCLTSTIGTKVVIFCISTIGNVSEFIEAVRNVVALYSPMIRMLSYFVYRRELVLLDREVGKKFEEELKNKNNRSALLKKISMHSKLMYVLVSATGVAIILYCAPRFIYIFKYKKYIHLFQGKYPFTVKPSSPVYWLVFVFETCVFYPMFHAMAGVDVAFGMHCFRISGLLRLAAQRFSNLKPDNPNYKVDLHECVTIHQLVIRAKVALQRVYGGIVMWNYIVSAFVMCTLMWQADKIKNQMTVPRLIFFIAYMVMKLLQSYIYASYGSSITMESENYQDAIYTSSWPGSGNVQLMKDLLLILTQRIVTLKAWGYFLITMEMFEKIIHTAISYFFLLQSLESKH